MDYAVIYNNYFNKVIIVKLCFNNIIYPKINKNINFNDEQNVSNIPNKIIKKHFLFINLIKKFFCY